MPSPAAAEATNEVPVGEILPGAMQPRNGMDDDSLGELAESIRENGIMQPLVVRPRDGGYELIAGERRWRAAQMAGLAKVPIVIRDVDDRTALELALVENLQRENLDPI
ncbi:MAG: ParB/RepB/Spo0J family partition protein, partial [Verrucomicrobiota bacterium]|nr:ParB/RepB/Spo0J family partition protein [Verrucomicrobiota bacterium]